MGYLHKLLETFSLWTLYVLVALVPIFLIPSSFATIPQAKLTLVSVLVGFAALGWLLNVLVSREIRIPRHALFFAVPLLPLAYIVSALTFGWPMSAVVSGLAEQDTVITTALLAAVFALTALTLKESAIAHISRAIMVGGAVLVAAQIVRLFFPDALTFGGVLSSATSSLAGTWHDLGILLGLFVITGGVLVSTHVSGNKAWRAFFGIVTAVSFLFLIVISMQDIWFVLAGILGIFGVYSWFAQARDGVEHSVMKRLVQPALWILIALSAFLFGWFNVWVHDRLPEKMQIVAVEVRPSWEGTFSVGQNSLTNSRALLFGTGPNSFARNWAQFKPEGVNETLFWNLDFNNGVGAVPTSFVTIGTIGIAAWILIALAFLWAAGEALRREKLFGSAQTITFGIVCAILYLLAFHVMYAPGLAISVLLFVLLGILVVHIVGEKKSILPLNLDSLPKLAGVVVALVLTVGTFVASATSLLALASDMYVNHSVALFNRDGGIGASTAVIQKALMLWPSNDRAHRAAVELGILELAQLGEKANTDEAARAQLEGTLSQTIEHGLQAVSIDRADYQNWLTLAQLYQELAGVGIEGAYEQAQQAYTTAREENPTNPLPLFRLAQLEVLKGNTSNAIDLFAEAITLKRDFAPAYFVRSQLLAQQNRLEEAIASAAPAVQLVPDDPLGWYNLGVILYLNGSFNEAGAAFAQAVNLRTDYSNAFFMLGLTYYQVGAPAEAVAALTRVLELNPNESFVATIIDNIRAGKQPFDGITQ